MTSIKKIYFYILLLGSIAGMIQAMDAPRSTKYDSPREILRAYFAIRKQKEQAYAQRFPRENDVARYTKYLQDIYPYCTQNAVEAMVQEDKQNAQKLLMDIWQIGGSDWYRFHSMITPPPPLPFRMPYISLPHRMAIALACIGTPLIIGGTYKIARLIKKNDKKVNSNKRRVITKAS